MQFLNKILANRIPQYIKRIIRHGQLGVSPEIQTDSIFKNALLIFSTLISQRKKKQMMVSTYADMTFEKFHYPLLIQEEKLLEK